MIKCRYFSKFLKLFLFGFGISCSMVFANSVDSAYMSIVGEGYLTSPYYNNYEIQVLKRGKFLSSYIGQAKPMFALAQYTYLFWNDDKLYIYDSFSSHGCSFRTVQGFFTSYKICDELTTNSSGSINCGNAENYNSEFVGTFLQSVTNGDIFYYNRAPSGDFYCRSFSNKGEFCFSSHSLGKSLCFQYNKPANGNADGLTGTLGFEDGLGYGFSLSYLSDPPGYSSIAGGSSEVGTAGLTGDVMTSTCTKSKALSWYEFNGYSPRLCYGGLSDFSTTTGVVPIAGQGLDVEEIRFNTNDLRRYGQTGSGMDYNEWFTYWRSVYEIYKKNREINNPFVGVPTVILTYFGFIDAYGLAYSNDTILEYCDLKLYTADLSSVYNGLLPASACNASLISMVDQQIASLNGTGPIIGSSWEGITDRAQYQGDGVPGQGSGSAPQSSGLNQAQDGLSFQNSFFNLLKSHFKYPSGSGGGALPSYIIITLIGLILFRFLKR